MFNLFNTHLNLDADDSGAGGGDGDFPAYMAQFADDLKQDKDIAKNKTLTDLGRAYKTQLVTIANTPKAPENVDGYEFDAVEYPEGFEADAEFDKTYRDAMLKAGLSKEHANAAYQVFAKTVIDQFKAAQVQFEADKAAADEQLKKDWPGEEYAKNMALRDRYIAKFGDEEMQADLDKTEMGNKVSWMKHSVKVAKAVGEDALGPGGPKDAGDAKSEKEKILDEMYPSMKDIKTGESIKPSEGVGYKEMYPSMGGS